MFRSDWIFVAKAVTGALVVMLTLVTAWSLLKRTTRSIHRGYWLIRFRLVFGLWPSKDPLGKKICRVAVDETLRSLEEPFRELCQAQEELDRKYSGNGAVKDPRKDAPHARDIRRSLWWAKKKFYGACDTAKKHGFAVQTQKEVE